MIYGNYEIFHERIGEFIEKRFVFTDPLHTLAYGTDASFYRLVPKIVIWVQTPSEVSQILTIASELSLPVVFRAAGTSISGQAITDSILIVTSRDWKDISIHCDASLVSLSPSVVGGDANIALAPYDKKIGPDPASINTAMIGGIAANNASGMCCGVADNSYKTLDSMKIIFQDGSRLNTADQVSRDEFVKTHAGLVTQVSNLSRKVKANTTLRDKITRKFKIKNTCGYSLNALVDFDDPIDIISHLMIGSEGTLGFIEEVTYRTVPEYRDKASSLMLFRDIKDACEAVIVMKTECSDAVDAAELMDRESLRCVEGRDGMPDFLSELGIDVTAVLVETRASSSKLLKENIDFILDRLSHIEPERALTFTDDIKEYSKFWKMRKGLYPAVGAVREAGTTVITEDVAYPIESLADAALDLRASLDRYGYTDAVIFGHSLEGNLHVVFTQSFETQDDIDKYEKLMDEITNQVAIKYQGSLKAEHGTGRNMAPYVELEWGADAYELMWEIKDIFDPDFLLNPGVILNKDKKIHLKNLKSMPKSDDLIDACIECGFCEPKCPSNYLTLTPRQRIVAYRHMTILRESGELEKLEDFTEQYQYDGIETCATCQLCSLACPVYIDTGNLTKKLRAEQIGTVANKIAWSVSKNYSSVLSVGRVALNAVDKMPNALLSGVSHTMNTITGGMLPQWMPSLPSGVKFEPKLTLKNDKEKVVYFSSCINRSMSNPHNNDTEMSIHEVVIALLERAGYEVIIPDSIDGLCCGMPFSSKGYKEQGKSKSDELEEALRIASQDAKYPIVCDMSPCSKTMEQNFGERLKVYDSIEFLADFLLDRLDVVQSKEPIVIHATCSTRKSGLVGKFEKLAHACSSKVTIPQSVSCCGFAGDRGFTYPELNKSALRHLKNEIPTDTKYAFSSSKTCEIGLSEHSGLEYRSICYLLERCSR